MGIQEDLDECSYKGATWFFDDSTRAGGRKDTVKKFVNSDVQSIEDMGLLTDVFTIKGKIAAFESGGLSITYQNNRNTLITALNSGGPGVFIHPFYGKIENVVVRTWTLNENTTSLGIAEISIVFEISNAPAGGQPVPSNITPAENAALRVILDVAVLAELASIETSGAAGGTHADAVSKMTEYANILDSASRTALRQGQVITDKFNKLQAEVNNFQQSVNMLVSVPQDLANATANLLRGLDGMFADAIDSFSAMQNMFSMGALDINFEGTQTYLSLQKQNNRNKINFGVKAIALGWSYLAATDLNLTTVAEIQAIQNQLEEQYQLLLESKLDKDAIEALTDQRANAIELFGQQKLTARRVINVRTNPTTYKLLSYQYYGESTQAVNLANLNSANTMAAKGNTDILTP